MEKSQQKKTITKNNQPIKAISHQDIYKAKESLEKLQSWTNTLKTIDSFFMNENNNLNKKKIIQEYHASSQIFGIFFKDFLTKTDLLEKQIEELRNREKNRL